MEQYLLDNVTRYQTLIQRFKPPVQKTTRNIGAEPKSNIVVSTRIRPLLEDEMSSGQVVATFPREDGSGVMDLHELKRVVRGLPTLNVSLPHLPDQQIHVSRSLNNSRLAPLFEGAILNVIFKRDRL